MISRNRLLPLAILAGVFFLILATAGLYLLRLDTEIRRLFDGKRWSLPAIVYARPLDVYQKMALTPELLESELQLGGYRLVAAPDGEGSYARNGARIEVISRGFHFSSGYEPSRRLTIEFADGRVQAITDTGSNTSVPFARLDPARIGSFHPIVHEDRVIVRRDQVPDLLVQTLLLIEDRSFFNHHGVSLRAIGRALIANVSSGTVVQGGSTLTQQLVKNLFLDRERSLARKAREAIMALLLEVHYSKDDILTAYINEVYLGQDRDRAIHGFALAGHHYFRRSLGDLRPDQIAILVGMVKGPSAYDPYRHQASCRKRRDTVLAIMAEHQLVDPAELAEYQSRPVEETVEQKSGFNRFPAFLDLVRQQLSDHYQEKDLTGNGLQIFTTLDPQIQLQVEHQLRKTIDEISTNQDRQLEGAVIITARDTGDILALAGGATPGQTGFNRVLQARRPIGSLIKPAIYLTALNSGYSLASPLDDQTISVESGTGPPWRPENYDRREHGRVPLFAALANSYNLATVRLGLALGLDNIIATIHNLGYEGNIAPFPSLLLGAIEMRPLEVCEMYQTIAAGGFHTSLHAISSVLDADHRILQRYGLAIEQRFSPETTFLLTHALQRVVAEGTGSALLRSAALRDVNIAGKTGTTDDLRDSWFAGFSDSYLGVVWLGRDDNKPTGVTGSGGAMRVWQRIMEQVPTAPLVPLEPSGITWLMIDRNTSLPARWHSSSVTRLPFRAGTEPAPEERTGGSINQSFRRMIESFRNLVP